MEELKDMKHIKLFLEHKIKEKDFPKYGYFKLNSKEIQILEDLADKGFLKNFKIIKEDNYYYTYYHGYYNQFDGFNELKDYVFFRYCTSYKESNKILELLKSTDLDPSFDDNYLIRWATYHGQLEIVKFLLKDPRVDPSANKNDAIISASKNGYTEIVKLLLKDKRVDPRVDNNYPFIMAHLGGHYEIVKLLLKDPRIEIVKT